MEGISCQFMQMVFDLCAGGCYNPASKFFLGFFLYFWIQSDPYRLSRVESNLLFLRGDGIMSKARFMSMKWLRLHLKEIIWATVILFVLSCFIIGYGSSRAQKNMDEKRRKMEAAEQKAMSVEENIPVALKDKLNQPALQFSYPSLTGAQVTRIVDVKTVFNTFMGSADYRKILSYPQQLRQAFGAQIKDNLLEDIISRVLIELHAEAHNLKPKLTTSALVERDRLQITPAEFDRRLKREGVSTNEYGHMRMQQEIIKGVFDSATRPVPVASLTDEALKKFYDDHKLRFKKDDEVTLKHLLVSPTDFRDHVTVSDEELKTYYDKNRKEFESSKRASIWHILIDPKNPDYLKNISIDEADVRRHYSDKIDEYKKPEMVKARHILIKPRNTFEKALDSFTVNLRDFKMVEGKEGQVKYQFEMGVSDQKTEMKLNFSDIIVIASDGQRFSLKEEDHKDLKNPISLPQAGSPTGAVFGTVCFVLPKDVEVDKLEIKDTRSVHHFEVAGAHDEEKSFEAAKVECEKLLVRLNDGAADFARLASDTSDDLGSKVKGGDLGEFPRGQMVKPFEDAAFAAKAGEIKGPIRTKYGYHLIKVEERIPARTTSLEEARDKIVESMRNARAEAKAQNDLDMVRELVEQGSRKFKDLVKEYSMGPSRKEEGRVPVFFRGELTEDYSAEQKKILEAEVAADGRIIEDIEEVVFNMKPNEISRVIKTSKGLHLIQVDSFLDPVPMGFHASVKRYAREKLEEIRRKEMAAAKSAELAKALSVDNFDTLASESSPAGVADLGALPFSTEVGFSNYALAQAIGQVSMDGRTYIPAIHSALASLTIAAEQVASGSFAARLIGPIETELGFHYLKVTRLLANQYLPFEKEKDSLKDMLSQEPSNQAIAAEFEKNREKFDRPAQRKVRQIVVSEESVAQDLYKRLQDGEIFGLLAQKYSIDGSSVNGGSLGALKKGQFPANLEEPLWNLKKGEFTKPVQTSYGWVVVQLDDHEIPGSVASLTTEVSETIKKSLRQKLQNELFVSFLTELRRKATVIRHPILNEL
jgi:parvulin-like peptidyl-prolyl isomerase